MYAIQWQIAGSVHEAVTATPGSAWEIYWALKKSCQKDRNLEDYWIRISMNCVPVNPEEGSALPCCRDGEGPTFILKAAVSE